MSLATDSGLASPVQNGLTAAGFGVGAFGTVASLFVLLQEAARSGPQVTGLEVAFMSFVGVCVVAFASLTLASATRLDNGGGA